MKKIYKKLTVEQIQRGVIFSSCLSKYTTEQVGNDIDDKFFNQSHFKYNIVRRI